MKIVKCTIVLIAILWPSTNVENGYIIVDTSPLVLVESGFINLLHEEVRGGKIW